LRTVPRDPGALAPAVDLELAGNCHARPGRQALIAQLKAFLATVEAATHKPTVLYIGDDFESRYQVRQAIVRPLWEPRFLLRPKSDWTIWQVDSFAHVDGIDGRVDLDVMR
jgi:lysozyme